MVDDTAAIIKAISGTRSIKLGSYAGDANYITSTGNDFILGSTSNNNARFYTNNLERKLLQGLMKGIGELNGALISLMKEK